MKIKLGRKTILDALTIVSQAIGINPILPILGNVKIAAGKDSIVLSSTDLDNFISKRIAAEVNQPGAITVPARLLRDFINRVDNSTVTLALTEREEGLEGDLARISGGDSEGILGVLAADEFPPAAPCEGGVSFQCSSEQLTIPLSKVEHSMSTDAARYILCGVNLACNGKKQLAFAATSGSRLSLYESELNPGNAFDVIVPTKSVNLILSVFSTKEDVTVEISEAVIRIFTEDTAICCKLVEGKFPNFRQVIPEKGDKVFALDKKDTIRGIDTARLFLVHPQIGIKIAGKNKSVELSAGNKSRVSLMSSELEGAPDFSIGFSYRNMLDALNVLDNETVRIHCSDETTPMVIREGGLTEVITAVHVA